MRDGSPTHDRDALAADAREFAATLEATHPDPYAGHGGRVAFHRRLETLLREIPEGGESLPQFARRLQSFAARVRDGHTQVALPDDAGDHVEGRLPVDWQVVGDGLYVDAVYERDATDLLGARLRAVEGVPTADLQERIARTESSDNAYGDRKALCDALGPDPGTLAEFVDADPASPTVTVETEDGETVERTLRATDADDPVATLDRAVRHPETSGEPAYRLLDGGDTALFSLPDCQTHREPIEAARAMYDELPGIYDLEATYRRVVGEPVPDDEAELLAGIPAVTEVVADLVETMADADAETLVVDTRGNGGGSSVAAYVLTYALHGRDGVEVAARDQYSVSKDSELYREQYGDDGPVDAGDNPAGFDFSDYVAHDTGADATVLDELARMSDTVAAELDAGAHDGYYRPENVVVVTDAETFSAGVEPAILLSKLGATVVGVPSAQAANGPRDVLTDDLPNTGLTYRVSYRHHVFQPGADGTVFEPDEPLTPERFEAMGRPADAGVLLALDTAD